MYSNHLHALRPEGLGGWRKALATADWFGDSNKGRGLGGGSTSDRGWIAASADFAIFVVKPMENHGFGFQIGVHFGVPFGVLLGVRFGVHFGVHFGSILGSVFGSLFLSLRLRVARGPSKRREEKRREEKSREEKRREENTRKE